MLGVILCYRKQASKCILGRFSVVKRDGFIKLAGLFKRFYIIHYLDCFYLPSKREYLPIKKSQNYAHSHTNENISFVNICVWLGTFIRQ